MPKKQANSFSTLKVYKTSILVFKDRAKYMMGEFRWQKYCKGEIYIGGFSDSLFTENNALT